MNFSFYRIVFPERNTTLSRIYGAIAMLAVIVFLVGLAYVAIQVQDANLAAEDFERGWKRYEEHHGLTPFDERHDQPPGTARIAWPHYGTGGRQSNMFLRFE